MIAMKVLDTLYIPDLDSTYVAFQSSEPLNGRKYIKLDASPGLIPVVLFAAAIIKFLTSEDD